MLGVYNYTVVLTYLGMLISVSGLTLVMKGDVKWGLICLMLSGVCDMFDGKVASTKADRTLKEKRFGIQIDSLSDVICFGVLPAAIVCAASQMHILAICIGCLYVLCALIRLAWFNVDEEERQDQTEGSRKTYLGLPVTTSALILPISMSLGQYIKLQPSLAGEIVIGLMAIAFLTPFHLRKPALVGKIIMLVVGAAGLALVILTRFEQ